MTISKIALALCSQWPLVCAAAPPGHVPQCPTELAGKLVQVQAAHPGWKGMAASRFVLARATVVTGPPDAEARAELRGDERRLSSRSYQTTYSGLDLQAEKWLVCAYGQSGDIEQAYRLPDVAQCVIKTSRSRDGNRNDVQLACS